MKKIFTIVLLGFVLGAYAQLPVSQLAEKKKAVLEEFTGKDCYWCPAGHKIAGEMKEEDPENVFLINIHQGGFATGSPNYRTAFGDALYNQSGGSGWPSGTINRQVFGGGNSTSLNRGSWASSATTIKTQDAYVNIAFDASVDLDSRKLVIDLEAYYTGDAPNSSNFINIAITQDDIKGSQSGASDNFPENIDSNGLYTHGHMLRHMVTGQWGEEITDVSTGDLFQKTYNYTLPDTIGDVPVDLKKLRIVTFVTETNQEIINANGGKPALLGLPINLEAQVMSAVVPESTCSASFDPQVSIRNWGNTAITSMKIEYSANNLPAQVYDWTGNLLGGLTKKITLPTLAYNSLPSNDILIKIVEVNGGVDDVLTNNEITAVVLEVSEFQTNTMKLTFLADQYSGGVENETSWKLFDSNGTVIQEMASGTVVADQAYDITLNLPNYDCYSFEFYDSFGDGIGAAGANTVSLDFNSTNVFTHTGTFSKLSTGFATVDASGNGNGNPTDNVDTTTTNPNRIIDLDLVSNFNVFPNPTTDIVNVSLEVNNTSTVQVALLDVLGRNVLNTELNNGVATFNVSKLNKGIYIINATSNGKAIATTSLVVR